MKRIALFLATNIAVLVVLSVVVRLIGADRFLTDQGLNLGSLLVFAAVIGFGGAIISLLMSKSILSYLSPVRYCMEVALGILLKGVGLKVLWSQCVALAATAALLGTWSIVRLKRHLYS